MNQRGQATGKLILTGEYAVVFGWPGLAVPAPLGLQATFMEDHSCNGIEVLWNDPQKSPQWDGYLREILNAITSYRGEILRGKLSIENHLPLGKGMGSSTALVIAVSRCLLGEDCRSAASAIEQRMNPEGSGIDFAVIWEERPLLFQKGKEPQPAELAADLLANVTLIDTGTPDQTTGELVAWVREQQEHCHDALATIGACTQMLLDGEALPTVLREHHRAQVRLGIVPPAVQELIAGIEGKGGAAKVLGAGARTGGGGMVLSISE